MEIKNEINKTEKTLELITTEINGISVIGLSGCLDISTSPLLDAQIRKLLDSEKYKIVIDLSFASYIASSGWGIFIKDLKFIRDNGGDIKLVGMKEGIYKLFVLFEFNRFFEHYSSVPLAIEAFK